MVYKLAGLLITVFFGCAGSTPAIRLLARDTDARGIWLAREVVVPSPSAKTHLKKEVSHFVVFHCRRTERHPVCHTARYVEGAPSEVIWLPSEPRAERPRRRFRRGRAASDRRSVRQGDAAGVGRPRRPVRREESIRIERRVRREPSGPEELPPPRLPAEEPLLEESSDER